MMQFPVIINAEHVLQLNIFVETITHVYICLQKFGVSKIFNKNNNI